ncbi:hypothetical protein [Treponema sp.]|uniref:hypothetical protein n=1 Tax=Treponema sp. TaxID=166 RepID=UPI003F049D2C
MQGNKNNTIIDPIDGTTYEKELHLFDIKKAVHSKDDAGALRRRLQQLNYSVNGKKAFDENGNHLGFRCSAKSRPKTAEGHNRRKKSWVEKLGHIDRESGDYEILLDYRNLDSAYKEIFGEALEEYNRNQRSNRRIKNYLEHIKNDRRQGTMKKSAKTDNSRKPCYEFIFQIGKRDNRLDTGSSKKVLKEFCLEWMPEHYPNIRPIGIYLHADEFTKDAATGEVLQGAVHIHFVYVPVAHALSKEEQEEEKRWKKELEEKMRKEAQEKGEAFDRTKFESLDWQLLRAKKFGKAIGNGMKLQTSLTGACCEMGFRTKGKLTAQIQMEEAVRRDLLDFAESYGIKVERTVDKDRDEEVSIQEYKKREDNKAVLAETKRLEREMLLIQKENRRIEAENRAKSEELEKRGQEVLHLEEDKKELEKKRADLSEQAEIIEEEKLRNAEAAEKNRENEEANERNARELAEKLESFSLLEGKYKKYASAVHDNEKIEVNVKAMGRQLKIELLEPEAGWRDKVDYAVSNFTERCQKVVSKLSDAIRGFKNFLQGKTAQDFRNLADDMDRNGTGTFEEYESKWSCEELDWQIERRQKKLRLKMNRRNDEIER